MNLGGCCLTLDGPDVCIKGDLLVVTVLVGTHDERRRGRDEGVRTPK